MRLELRTRGVDAAGELRDFLVGRLRPALARLGRRVGRVRVYLRDVNGPRGGLDKQCRVVVDLPPRGRVVVTGADADVRDAITATASRAGLAVKRRLQRRRTRLRRRGRGMPAAPGGAAGGGKAGAGRRRVGRRRGPKEARP